LVGALETVEAAESRGKNAENAKLRQVSPARGSVYFRGQRWMRLPAFSLEPHICRVVAEFEQIMTQRRAQGERIKLHLNY